MVLVPWWFLVAHLLGLFHVGQTPLHLSLCLTIAPHFVLVGHKRAPLLNLLVDQFLDTVTVRRDIRRASHVRHELSPAKTMFGVQNI